MCFNESVHFALKAVVCVAHRLWSTGNIVIP